METAEDCFCLLPSYFSLLTSYLADCRDAGLLVQAAKPAVASAEEDIAEAVDGEVNDESAGGEADTDQEEHGCAVMEKRHGGVRPGLGRNVQIRPGEVLAGDDLPEVPGKWQLQS